MPTYQTKPLVEYQQAYQEIARDLFLRVSEQLPPGNVVEYKGSYSVLASTSRETVAKIVVYDPEIGRRSDLPFMRDGVYVWIRSNGALGPRIFTGALPEEMGVLFRRMDRNRPISIAPHHDTEFRYLPVMAGDDPDEIAHLLVRCARI